MREGGAAAPPSIEMRDLAGEGGSERTRPDRELSVDTKEMFTTLAKPETTLPEGWTATKTSEGKTCFFNAKTGVTSWTRPNS